MASVLVIDDDPQVRGFIRLVLEAEGHEIREAANGAEGITAHRQQAADLILCDLFMPEKEGLETIWHLLGEFPDLKIVAMSGGSRLVGGRDVLQVAKAFGAVEVVEKPLERDSLVATVQVVWEM